MKGDMGMSEHTLEDDYEVGSETTGKPEKSLEKPISPELSQ